jgi:hypothetical protein
MNNNAFPKRRALNGKKCVIKVSKNGKMMMVFLVLLRSAKPKKLLITNIPATPVP